MTRRETPDDPVRHQSAILESLGVSPSSGGLYSQVLQRMLSAAETIGMPREQQLILARPKNVVTVNFPVLMDDGEYQMFTGMRVQHNDALGPFKGGLRFAPNLSQNDLGGLALLMMLKSALLRLPFGGASGGVACDPTVLSREELMRVVRRFAAAIAHHIGPDYDVPGPDVGADPQVMAWFADTTAQMTPDRSRQGMRAIVTGKPPEIGGASGRALALGTGLLHVLRELLPDFNMKVQGLRFSVCGFGRMGGQVANMLTGDGARLVGALDRRGGILCDAGMEPAAVSEQLRSTGGLSGVPGSIAVDEEQFYRAKPDVLVVAAGESIISSRVAEWIGAPVIAEVAHAPWTPDGDDVLFQRGIEVIPSVLGNAGAVAGSYLEWVQNRSFLPMNPTEFDAQVEQLCIFAARRMRIAKSRYETDWRTAAYSSALESLSRVYELRGIFP